MHLAFLCLQATALSPAAIPGAMAADNLAMAAYLAAVMAVPVASRQMSSSVKSSVAALQTKNAASAVAGSVGTVSIVQQQDITFASPQAGSSRAAAAAVAAGDVSSNAVPAAVCSAGLAVAVTESLPVTAAASASLQAVSIGANAAGQHDVTVHRHDQHSIAMQDTKSPDDNAGSSTSTSDARGPTADSVALSVAAGCIACALGHHLAGIMGSSSLSLMIMALVASSIGSVAAVVRPSEPLFTGR